MTTEIQFSSRAGHHLVGTYFPGEAAKPLALLLHGIPGNQKNHDIAAALHALGWHALVLHFSGAWGSGGNYEMAQHPQDVLSALDFALGEYAIKQVAVIGYSLGSRAAIMAAHADQRIGAVVSISGIADFSEVMLGDDFFAECVPLLQGSSVEILRTQFQGLGKGLQPYEALPQLAPRSTLIVHGTADEVVPFYHAEAFPTSDYVQRVAFEGGDHDYSQNRAELITTIRDFLRDWAG